MTRTNVMIDTDAVDAAAKILGTSSRSETIRAAIDEVLKRERLKELADASVTHRHTDPKVLAKIDELAWK